MPVTAMPFLGSASLPKFGRKVHAVVSFNDNCSVMEETRLLRTASGQGFPGNENDPRMEPMVQRGTELGRDIPGTALRGRGQQRLVKRRKRSKNGSGELLGSKSEASAC